MSLEADIQTLNKSVRELIEALNSYSVRANNAEVVKKLEEARTVPPANEDEAKAQRDAEKAGNDSPKPLTTTDTSPPSSNESRMVTYADVKNATIAVSKIDKAKAVAGLARFGVQTAKALNEDQWLEYVSYMKKVAAPLDRRASDSAKASDNEASHE